LDGGDMHTNHEAFLSWAFSKTGKA